MAICKRCGTAKLSERPCPNCGHWGNADEAVRGVRPTASAPISVNMPEGVPMAGTLGFDSAAEIEPAFNMRRWVQEAVEARGAKMVGGGIGCGQADIDIELEGHRYNISIRALKSSS